MSAIAIQYFLNHHLDAGEVERQSQELLKGGYQNICAHARQGMLTPYFSEEWWQAYDKIVATCERAGAGCWIWDEDYFPSGLAGGRIVWNDPGLISRGLVFTVKEVQGSGPFYVDFEQGMLLRAFAVPLLKSEAHGDPIDITCFCGTRRQTWSPRRLLHGAYSPHIGKIGHPHWRCGMTENRFATAWSPAVAGKFLIVGVVVQPQQQQHPDMLNPASARKFIEMCYEPYALRYGNKLGRVIKAVFTDEPSPGGWLYPWTTLFPDEFQSDHGYDPLPYLSHLVLDIDDRSQVFRHNYRQTQYRLQKSNYVDQIAAWCREHRIQFSGHLTRTEWLTVDSYYWPNELRCYQSMDIPATDPLGASHAWRSAAAYHTGLKVASSAAHLFGRKQAGSDALAVIGDEARLRDIKSMLDYQMCMGINFFMLHGASYSMQGPRKDEVPPTLFHHRSDWKYMRELMSYIGKTCEALTGGQHLCDIALLYPSTSLACQLRPESEVQPLPDEERIHELSELLLSNQRDFDFIDEITLQECVTENGSITTPEKYRVILLPYIRFIDGQAAQALDRFAAAGGRVIAMGSMPSILGKTAKDGQREWANPDIQIVSRPDKSFVSTLPGVTVEGDGCDDLFVLRRKTDEHHQITFAYNRNTEPFTGSIEGKFVRIMPGSGQIISDSAPGKQALKQEIPKFLEDISSDWTVRFCHNSVPLNFWHYATGESPASIYSPGINLLDRQTIPANNSDVASEDIAQYMCRFMLQGRRRDDVADVKIVMEDQAILGQWKLSINGTPITQWSSNGVVGCRTITASVAHALQSSSTPELNTVVIETSGHHRGLNEVIYLTGQFDCEYRYQHPSQPFLSFCSETRQIQTLQPWNILGHPTFSGSAFYRKTIHIPEAGNYILDMGQVEDIAEVRLDGVSRGIVPWPPYLCSLDHLSEGQHELEIEITNCSANGIRSANLPAGMLGPVRMGRLSGILCNVRLSMVAALG